MDLPQPRGTGGKGPGLAGGTSPVATAEARLTASDQGQPVAGSQGPGRGAGGQFPAMVAGLD